MKYWLLDVLRLATITFVAIGLFTLALLVWASINHAFQVL